MGGVVALDEVLDGGAGFPEGEVGVWVVDGGEATVGLMARYSGFLTSERGQAMIL